MDNVYDSYTEEVKRAHKLRVLLAYLVMGAGIFGIAGGVVFSIIGASDPFMMQTFVPLLVVSGIGLFIGGIRLNNTRLIKEGRAFLTDKGIDVKPLERKVMLQTLGSFAGFIVVIVLLTMAALDPPTSPKDKYDDVFEKNPNEWSDDEKDYVDDLFDWIDKNN